MISLFELEYREDVIEYMYEMEVRFEPRKTDNSSRVHLRRHVT